MDFKTTVLFVVFFTIASIESVKIPLRPVYEITGETIDSYGNPLAAQPQENMKVKAKLHIRNQKIRFESEKDRRHRAQVRRLKDVKTETMDSYVKAYQEQMENYQMKLESKHIKDLQVPEAETERKVLVTDKINNVDKTKSPEAKRSVVILEEHPVPNWWRNLKQNRNGNRQGSRNVNNDEGVKSNQRQRDSRAAGYPNPDLEYFMPIQPEYGTRFDQRVETHSGQKNPLRPVITHHSYNQEQKLNVDEIGSLTTASLSNDNTHQQYSQLSGYKSQQDLKSLSELIGKEPEDQLIGLEQLLKRAGPQKLAETFKNKNINLDSSNLDSAGSTGEYSTIKKYDFVTPYSVTPSNYYGQTYQLSFAPQEEVLPIKDHTPITEHVQDIADTRKPVTFTAAPKYFYPTEAPTTHTSSSNYYKVEVASHVVSVPESKLKYLDVSGSSSGSPGHDNVSIQLQNTVKLTINANNNHNNTRRKKKRTRYRISNATDQVSSGSHTGEVKTYIKSLPGVVDASHFHITNETQQGKSRNRRQIMSHLKLKSIRKSNHKSKRQIELQSSEQLINNEHTKNEYDNFDHLNASNLTSLSLDSSMFVTGKDYDSLDDAFNSNCTFCTNANLTFDDSEFYYYDDDKNDTDTNFDEDFFPLINMTDEKIFETQNITNVSDYIDKLNLTEDNPRFEALVRFKFSRQPHNLYRVFNGRKTRISNPNFSRFRKYLIKKPFYNNRYNNIHNNRYNDYQPSHSNYQFRNNFDAINKFNRFNSLRDHRHTIETGDEYGDEINDYEDEESANDDYHDNYDDSEGHDGDFYYNYLSHIDPYDNANSESRYNNRYASDYDQNGDYISIDNPYFVNRYNYRHRPSLRNPHYHNRYASDFDEYIDEERYNNYQKQPVRYFDEDDYGDYNDDNYNHNLHINKGYGEDYEESQYFNIYSNHNDNDDYNDHRGGGYYNNRKRPQPSNYYVENFNQFVTRPNHDDGGYINGGNRHRRPQNTPFNIFRAHHYNKGGNRLNPSRRPQGDLIHIDSYNVFPGQKTSWRQPSKARPFRRPRRPGWRPGSKGRWRLKRPKYYILRRRPSSKVREALRIHHTLNKIHSKIRHFGY